MLAQPLIIALIYILLGINSPDSDLRYLPKGQLYPQGIADTNNPTTSVSFHVTPWSNIPRTQNIRIVTKMGAMIEVAEMNYNGKETQFDFGGMMKQQTDPLEQFDLIGWDGIIRSHISVKWTDRITYKIGYQHRSAHRGDEYLIRSESLERKNFTRDENLVGISYKFHPEWRSYFEFGYRVTDNDFNNAGPIRLQGGIEYEKDKYYAAIDLESEATHDYTPGTNFQTGIQYKDLVADKTYRLGIEIYSGQVRLAEFSETREHLIAFGFWIEL